MNDNSLNGRASNGASLSQLYRRMAQQGVDAAGIDADGLVAAASGQVDEALANALAGSPAHADLARLLRELEPASAELADSVRRQACIHPQRDRAASRPVHQGRRVARRGARWFGGLAVAAGLAMALGIVGLWHGPLQSPHVPETAHVASAPDRIFASNDRIFAASESAHPAASPHGRDKLFRGDFSGS